MAFLGVNMANYDAQSFEPIPPGDYEVAVTNSEVKKTKNGGMMVSYEFTTQNNPHFNNRKIFDNFLLGNAVAMARMKSLFVACHPSPDSITDSDQIHGYKLIVKVKIETQEGYEPKNKISVFKKIPTEPLQAPNFQTPSVIQAPQLTPQFQAPPIQPPPIPAPQNQSPVFQTPTIQQPQAFQTPLTETPTAKLPWEA